MSVVYTVLVLEIMYVKKVPLRKEVKPDPPMNT